MNNESSDDEDINSAMHAAPSSFGKKTALPSFKQRRTRIEDEDEEKDSTISSVLSSLNHFHNTNQQTKIHSTYGKGAKMLMSMGFKVGQGLGKDQKGIKEPIQVKVSFLFLFFSFSFFLP